MTGLARGVGVDVAALQQIVEASDAVPAVSGGFEQERVLAALIGLAVIFRQQVDQKFSSISMPLPALAGFLSAQTYQSRYGESGELRASRNHLCASEAWLTARSMMARVPRCRPPM